MSNRDERLSRTGENRKERESADRPVTQDRELTDGQRLDMLRSQFFQVALPDLPPIPGYHVCWLTTTNPRDPIHGRMRLGYEPIKASDVAGWEHAGVKSGEWEGCVGVNEMLAFKLPIHLYQMYMQEAHHDAPMREEEKLSSTLDLIREQAERKGARVEAGNGNEELGTARPVPVFE
jgi:hypothetical protein